MSLKKVIRTSLVLACWSSLFSASPLLAQNSVNIDQVWRQAALPTLNGMERFKSEITEQVTRLEGEVRRANRELSLAESPGCVDIICDELEALYYQISKAEVDAETSFRVAKMAVQNWDQYYRNQRGSASAVRADIQAQLEDEQSILFYQNVAATVAEVAALVATGGNSASLRFTGSATEIGTRLATERMNNYIATVANYSLNRFANSVTGVQDIAGSSLGQLTNNPTGSAALESLGNQLTRVGLVRANGQGGFAWTADPRGNITSKLNAVDTGVQVLIDVLTNGSISATERRIQEAEVQLGGLLQAERAILRTVAYARVAAVEAAQLRVDIIELKSRIERLRIDCSRQIGTRNCGVQFESAKQAAQQEYDRVVAQTDAESEAASALLSGLRQQRDAAMARAQRAHESLRGARDQVATTTQTTSNRALIEELARNARDPEVRAQYQAQLDALNNAPSAQTQATDVSVLEQERDDAWQEVERLNSEISRASREALQTYAAGEDLVIDAQLNFIAVMSELEQSQLDCLEALRPANLPPITRNQELLERGGTYGPDEIFGDLSRTLSQLSVRARDTEVRFVVREDGECAINYELAGCFQSDHQLYSMDLLLEAADNRARATIIPSHDPLDGPSLAEDFLLPQVYTGTRNGSQLSLTHRYTEADREQLRRLVSTNNDDAVIDVLLDQGATATIQGSLVDNVQIESLYGQSYGSIPANGIRLDTANLNIQFLSYDLQPEAYTLADEPPACVGVDAILTPVGVCVAPIESELRNPQFFNLSASASESPTLWVRLNNVAQFAENPVYFTEPFSDNNVTDYENIDLGDLIWIETQVNSFSCDFQQESIFVRIEPEQNPAAGFLVELIETAPNSGIFRSTVDGVALDFEESDVMNGPVGNIRLLIEGREDPNPGVYSFISIY